VPELAHALEQVQAAAGQTGLPVQVTTERVQTIQDAQRRSFPGSPTILIGGRDPFAQLEMVSALACRVYPTDAGLAGTPTIDLLAQAFRDAAQLGSAVGAT
jgi:hypothetical protein